MAEISTINQVKGIYYLKIMSQITLIYESVDLNRKIAEHLFVWTSHHIVLKT